MISFIDNDIRVVHRQNLDALQITLRGEMTLRRFLSLYDTVLDNAAMYPNMNLVWDARRIRITSLKLDQFKTIFEYAKKSMPRRGNGLSAWVFSNVEDYRLACTVNACFGKMLPVQVEIFRGVFEAEAWFRSEVRATKVSEVV